jgi:hypothetical protein
MAASASLDDIDLAALKVSQTWKSILKCNNLLYRVYVILAVLRIRDPVPFWPLAWIRGPECVKRSESGMNIPDNTYFRELRNNFLG